MKEASAILIAGTVRRLRGALLRALPFVLVLCMASPIIAEAGHDVHAWTTSSQQTAQSPSDDPVPHETTCIECPQHAWERGREAIDVAERRAAAHRVAHALVDDRDRPSVVGTIVEPPRA